MWTSIRPFGNSLQNVRIFSCNLDTFLNLRALGKLPMHNFEREKLRAVKICNNKNIYSTLTEEVRHNLSAVRKI